MNFSKLKLQEGQATGDYTGLAATKKVSDNATQGGITAKNDIRSGHEKQLGQGTQRGTYGGTRANRTASKRVDIQANKIYNDEYFKNLITEKEQIKAFEAQKSDWREDLQEKLADGKEREDHPFVTVMPTGDENLIQAIKQMRGEVKDKKEKIGTGANVQEGYEDTKKSEVLGALDKKKGDFKKRYGKDAADVMHAVAAKTAKKKGDTSKSDDRYAYEETSQSETEVSIVEKKKDCKDGYKWDSEEGKCVKKKKSSTYILGRGYGYGHHHHHDDDDKEDNTDNGSDGADAGGDAGGGGGMGEMFDFLGDMFMQEMNYKDAQEKGMTVSSNPPPIDHAELNRKRVKKAVLPQTSDKDRAK